MNAQLREHQRAYDNQSEPEPRGMSLEQADMKVRDDELLMTELIGEVTAISDDNWLVHALVYYYQTGDFNYLRNQADKHIEPVIQARIEQEMDR
jgi:replicative superfamily II helicase